MASSVSDLMILGKALFALFETACSFLQASMFETTFRTLRAILGTRIHLEWRLFLLAVALKLQFIQMFTYFDNKQCQIGTIRR